MKAKVLSPALWSLKIKSDNKLFFWAMSADERKGSATNLRRVAYCRII
jgi:hypothetical protein